MHNDPYQGAQAQKAVREENSDPSCEAHQSNCRKPRWEQRVWGFEVAEVLLWGFEVAIHDDGIQAGLRLFWVVGLQCRVQQLKLKMLACKAA